MADIFWRVRSWNSTWRKSRRRRARQLLKSFCCRRYQGWLFSFWWSSPRTFWYFMWHFYVYVTSSNTPAHIFDCYVPFNVCAMSVLWIFLRHKYHGHFWRQFLRRVTNIKYYEQQLCWLTLDLSNRPPSNFLWLGDKTRQHRSVLINTSVLMM